MGLFLYIYVERERERERVGSKPMEKEKEIKRVDCFEMNHFSFFLFFFFVLNPFFLSLGSFPKRWMEPKRPGQQTTHDGNEKVISVVPGTHSTLIYRRG